MRTYTRMDYLNDLGADRQRNADNTKGRLLVTAFRTANFLALNRQALGWRIGAFVFLPIYVLLVNWILGVEVSYHAKVGPGLRILHGQCLVVSADAVLGARVTLRHGVTIGNKGLRGPSPIIEDDVEVGANAIIIGGIRVGRGAVVGAGAVVVKDVPAGAIVAGNPARVIRQKV